MGFRAFEHINYLIIDECLILKKNSEKKKKRVLTYLEPIADQKPGNTSEIVHGPGELILTSGPHHTWNTVDDCTCRTYCMSLP